MTKKDTHATIYWVPASSAKNGRAGYAWRICLQPGRIRIDRGSHRVKTPQGARESLDAALGLLRLEIPERQIKVIPRPEPKPCPQ